MSNRGKLQDVYQELSLNDCVQERENLKVKLSLIKLDPANAHLLWKGKVASVLGDIMIVTSCKDVSLTNTIFMDF